LRLLRYALRLWPIIARKCSLSICLKRGFDTISGFRKHQAILVGDRSAVKLPTCFANLSHDCLIVARREENKYACAAWYVHCDPLLESNLRG